jgi:hypothetical protein
MTPAEDARHTAASHEAATPAELAEENAQLRAENAALKETIAVLLARVSVMRWTSPGSGAAAPFGGQDVFSSGRLCDVGGVHRSRSGEVGVPGSRR